MTKCSLWILSILVSVFLALNLLSMWIKMDDYQMDKSTQITTQSDVDRYLTQHANKANALDAAIRIPTGIFIQSMKFFNSSEVNITGYVWQHFPVDTYRDVKDEDLKPGFILPEQVNTAGEGYISLAYRFQDCRESQQKKCDTEVLGWYFEATLKQKFDYSKYPFDHKTVWVRLWPSNFYDNIVLIPDFTAYSSTDEDAIFGMEKSIVLGSWESENTYFDYKMTEYDTNFGIPDYIGMVGFPELHYNLVIKRRFDDAFIIYVFPLFLVSILLFASLLTITESREKNELLGFSTSGFLGMCSALFFVILVAHIQLREQFAGSIVVYLEYFYILMYTMLVLATINAYLFSIKPNRLSGILCYQNNIIPKITFWPLILGVLNIITQHVLMS